MKRYLHIVLPVVTLAILLSLTFLLWQRALRHADETLSADFEYHFKEKVAKIESRMRTYRDILAGAQGLFAATQPTRRQFADYVSKFGLNQNYRGVQGVGYVPLIRSSDLKTMTAVAHRDGLLDFHVYPLDKRDVYAPIYYLEPFKGRNLQVYGFNMYSEPSRREAMARAAKTGEAALTGIVRLADDEPINPQVAFIMFLPIYKQGAQPSESNIIGWVYSPFNANDLVEGILGPSTAEFDLEIYDSTGVSSASLLYDSDNIHRAGLRAKGARFSQVTEITVAGREWTVVLHSLDGFEKNLNLDTANLVGLIGIACSFFVAITLWFMTTSRERALAMVESKTRELSEVNNISKWIHSIDRALSEPSNVNDVINAILHCMTHETRWRVAGYWQVLYPSENLHLLQVYSQTPERHEEFVTLTKQIQLKRGQGLPGQVQLAGEVAWIPDFDHEHQFLRSPAARRCGLRSGLAIPVRSAGRTVGVLEVFSDELVVAHESATKELKEVGLRIGHKLEKLQLTHELKAEKDRLKQLMEAINASAIVSITDPRGTIVSVNEKFCEVSGYARSELLGQNHRILNSGLERKGFFKDMWRTISSGKNWSGEIRNRSKNGEIYTVASVITPIKTAEGDIESYLSVRFDLTAQKKYEQQLLEAQSMAKIGSWHFEAASKTLTWSREHYRIFEVSESQEPETLWQIYRSRIHPDDLLELDRVMERASKNENDFVFDHRIVLDGGSRIKYVQGIGKVTRSKTGEMLSMSGTCQDVTERVTREAEYRMTLDAVGIGVWKYNPISKELMLDHSMCKLYEFDEADQRTPFDSWVNAIAHESRARVLEELRDTVANKHEFNVTYEIVTKSGCRKQIASIGSVVRNHKGEAIMVYGLNLDRTSELESQRELERQRVLMESVLDNIPNMVFVKDAKNELRFTLLNKAAEKLLGAKQSDFLGKTEFDVTPHYLAQQYIADDLRVFAQGSVVKIERETLQTSFGLRQLRTYKVPTYDHEGKPSLLIGISTDITEEIQMQEQLELERAKSLHNAKLASLGEMSAGIAHEINNPLAIIDGIARTLKRHKDDPARFEAKIESLTKSTARISRIVNGLRKFARTTDGAAKEQISLAKIFEEVAILTEAKSKRHSTPVEFDIRTSASIDCDSVEIEQVFVNLVNNGIDAIKESSERWLRVSAFDDEDEIVVRVIDSGAGIPIEVEQKLFQPFFTTKPVGEGTGLGLSIAKGILDQHRATISINRSMKNTCFEIRFLKSSGVESAA